MHDLPTKRGRRQGERRRERRDGRAPLTANVHDDLVQVAAECARIAARLARVGAMLQDDVAALVRAAVAE